MSKLTRTYAARNVPRYTSYPTAPHFHSGVDATVYSRWLTELTCEDSLSLYLHVPFCRDICHYCGCLTKASRQDAPLQAYGDTLLQELELVADRLKHSGPVKHIHWGGGTPSLLPRQAFLEITGMMRVLFELAPDLEHAIELDPRHVTTELTQTLRDIGITRTSLGVQDFDRNVQKAIGRVQPRETVERALEMLRDAGLKDVNFDLMYGLPGQSEETVASTIKQALALQPSRISLFGYAHVPWMKKNQRLIDETLLPQPADRLAMAALAREALVAGDYQQIGLDHFALPDDSMATALADGTLHRNFQGYTTDQASQLIGLGVSSIGKLKAGYAQNISDVAGWRKKVQAGELPIARGFALTDEDQLRGDIIERLMTNYRCNLPASCNAFGLPLSTLDDALGILAPYVADGLARHERDELVMTPEGRPFVRLVASAFDAYLKTAPSTGASKQTPPVPRHSMAV
ncbi:oxygen-independent coproporphyrinogen III oxidase [Roseibium sp.]|uniref:oxygen-independent coproporphyrinogen III oxidase n=1 Tax=Roseibium sp. TaxID=1936156 RepID=UPI003A9779BA